MRDAYNHRLRLVESARQRGIKPTARLFATTVPTVRKWLRRYQQHGSAGLVELSRAPHRQPRKTSPQIEHDVVELRKTLPTFGARRLIREFDLPVSHRALERIWRAHGLMPKRRRKYQRKQDLAAIKATWRLFQQISADTKDLDDIPHFWPQAQRLRLPAVQYTARDVRSGLLFLAFAQPAARRPAKSSPHASSAIWTATASRSAIWSGRPTTAVSSSADTTLPGHAPASPPPSGTVNTCASRPPRTPTRATSKPCIGWSKTSSSTWKPSPAGASSWPRRTPISSTSTWCGPTRTRKTRAPGKSSSGSLLARRSNSACFHRCSWITTSTTPGDTMSLGFPRKRWQSRVYSCRFSVVSLQASVVNCPRLFFLFHFQILRCVFAASLPGSTASGGPLELRGAGRSGWLRAPRAAGRCVRPAAAGPPGPSAAA